MKDRTGKTLTFTEILKKIFRRLDAIEQEFEMMIVRWAGFVPSHYFRRFVYRLSGMTIGKGSTLHTGGIFYDTRHIRIGEDTIVGENVVMDGRAPLRIGNHVDIASEVMIYNSQHDIQSADFAPIEKEVEIGDYVFIGPRVIILPGVHIGRGAVVGAGAVVTKDVVENTVVGGVPAKEIGKRTVKDYTYKLGRARWFR